ASSPTVCLEPDEFGHVVFRREPWDFLLLMFPYSPHQSICHAGVQDARLAYESVDVEGSIHEESPHASTPSFRAKRGIPPSSVGQHRGIPRFARNDGKGDMLCLAWYVFVSSGVAR